MNKETTKSFTYRGTCTFDNPNGMATSFGTFTAPGPDAFDALNVRPLGYNVTVA